jgi:hypothetical protein
MPTEFKGAIFACLAVTAFMVMIPPAMLGGREDTLGHFLYDYQTLITGFAAVGAAFVTVWKMTETEIAQGRRHQQSIDLAQRADRIALERAINPQLKDLASVHASLQALDLSKDRFNDDRGDPEWRLVSSICGPYLRALRSFKEICSRQAFIDGRKLFDGELTMLLEVAESLSGYITASLAQHDEIIDPQNPNDNFEYQHEFEDFGPGLIEEVKMLPPLIAKIVTKLQQTENRYFKD